MKNSSNEAAVFLLNRRRENFIKLFITLLILVLVYVTSVFCKVDFTVFGNGISKALEFVLDMFPPDKDALVELLIPALETVFIALVATLLGTVIALFFACASASNLAPQWLRLISRGIIALERSLPETIIVLLLIAALGLGPFPGIIALSLGCVGMLGRLFSDAIEEIPAGSLESIQTVGASKLQLIRFGVIPQILPTIIANAIFRFEVNIRLSVLLGAIGAGGVGYELYYSFSSLQYQRACAAILITLVLVFGSEKLSGFLRKKYAPEAKL